MYINCLTLIKFNTPENNLVGKFHICDNNNIHNNISPLRLRHTNYKHLSNYKHIIEFVCGFMANYKNSILFCKKHYFYSIIHNVG